MILCESWQIKFIYTISNLQTKMHCTNNMNILKIWNWEIDLNTSLLELNYETFDSSQKFYCNKTAQHIAVCWSHPSFIVTVSVSVVFYDVIYWSTTSQTIYLKNRVTQTYLMLRCTENPNCITFANLSNEFFENKIW